MVRAIALLVIAILSIRMGYRSKAVAQKRCSEFLAHVIKSKNHLDDTQSRIVKDKRLDTPNDFIKVGEKVFLIEKGQSLIVYSLNNDRRQTILESQYRKIEKKLDSANPAYTYSLGSYSIYYRLPSPNERCILRIDS